MQDSTGSTLAWLRAARNPAVVADLESIFADASAAIAARGPACWASGRCCNFESAGHRLYTTGLEAAYTFSRAADRVPTAVASAHATSVLSLSQLHDARQGGGCPFQHANLCSVHDIKPVACRVYFCDRSAQSWQQELSERLHQRVKDLHTDHGVPYQYAEWRTLLDLLLHARREGDPRA